MRALNYSLSSTKQGHPGAQGNCHAFVDTGGLAHIFGLFSKIMPPQSASFKQWKKSYKGIYHEREDTGKLCIFTLFYY